MAQISENNATRNVQKQNWQTAGRFGSTYTSSADHALREQLHQEIENKAKPCSNPTFKCSMPRLDGHEYCIRHILHDPRGLYIQCTYVYGNGRKCLNAMRKDEISKANKALTTYCFQHSRQAQLHKTRTTIGRFQHVNSSEVLLNDISSVLDVPATKVDNHVDDEEEFIDVETPAVSMSIPYQHVKSLEKIIEADKLKPRILNYASDSSEEDDNNNIPLNFDNDEDDSDDISLSLDEEHPLEHAGVYTFTEALRISIQKMKKQRDLYQEEIVALHHRLKEQRRVYLNDARKERETYCNIQTQANHDAHEREQYEKLKMLTKYHRRHGVEGLMYRKYKEKLAQINNGAINKQVFFPKCVFTEGGVKCGLRVIPCTKYCHKHILEDKKQVLFRACKVEKSNVVCHEPTICLGEETNCLLHWVIPPKQQYSQKKNDSETDDDTESQKLKREVEAILATTRPTTTTEPKTEESSANVDTEMEASDEVSTRQFTRSQRISRRSARKPLRSSVRRRTTRTQSPVNGDTVTTTTTATAENASTSVETIEEVAKNIVADREQTAATITPQISTTTATTIATTTIATTTIAPVPIVEKNDESLKITELKNVETNKNTFMLPPKILKIPLQQSDEEQSTQSRVKEVLAKRERQLKQQQQEQAQPQPQQQIKVQQLQQTLPQKLQIAPRPMPAIEQKSQTTLAQPQAQQPQVIKLPPGSFKFAYIRPLISGGGRTATIGSTPIATTATLTTTIATSTVATITPTLIPTKSVKIATTSSNLYLFPGLPISTSVTVNKLLLQTTTNTMTSTTTLTTSASGVLGKHKMDGEQSSELQIKRINVIPIATQSSTSTLAPIPATTPTTSPTKSSNIATIYPNFIVQKINKNDEIAAANVGVSKEQQLDMSKQLERLKMKNSLEIQPKITTIPTTAIAAATTTVSTTSPIMSTIRKVQNLNSIKLLRKSNNQETPIIAVSTATSSSPNLTAKGNAKSFRLRNVTITPTWGTNLNLNNNNNNSDNASNNNNNSNVKSSSSATVKVSAAAATTLQDHVVSTVSATATAKQRPQASTIATTSATTTIASNKEILNVGTKVQLDATQFRYLTKYNTVVRATSKPKTIVSNIKTTTTTTTTPSPTSTTATAITTTTATTSTTSLPRIQIIKLPFKNSNLLQ